VIGRLVSRLQRSAALSAALSFVLPGLGQGLSGAIIRGALLALPVLVLFGFVLAALGHGMIHLAGQLLQPPVIVAILVVDVVLLVYRAAAIVDAYLLAQRRHPVRSTRRHRAISIGVLAVLLVTTLSMHAWLGVVELKTYDAVARITSPYGPNGGVGELPTAAPTPTLAPGATPGPPTPTPAPTPVPPPPWAADGRLNILLVGGDAGPGRWSLRTDSMILASVDIATARTSLFGIPRNLVNVPLPPESAGAFACKCFPQLLNALYVYAGAHPNQFPGGDARGYLALQGAVSALTGVQVDGMIVVDLNGFVKLVNALGGININVPYAIYDSHYPLEDGSGDVPLYIKAGQQHMDGHLALAYARTRHQDDDYHRMVRQQQVLVAIRQAVNPCTIIPRLPDLIDIAGQSLWTDFSIKDLPDILELAARVKATSIAHYAFDPPTIPEYLNAAGVAKVQAMVANAFKGTAPTPVPTPAPWGVPTLTPSPTPGSICG
jgi:LCP family protein required for cell wall assembly